CDFQKEAFVQPCTVVIFVVELYLVAFGIRSRAILSVKDLRRPLAASFLKFVQYLIRLGRSVGAGAEKSGNRNADGWPHPHKSSIAVHSSCGLRIILLSGCR